MKRIWWPLLLLGILSCGNPRDNAKKELEKLGIEFSESSFLFRLRKGDLILTNLFLQAGMNPNVRFKNSGDSVAQGESNDPTPLMIAAREGHSKVVRTLLMRRADPNAVGDNGQTALMYAARYAPYEVIELLLDAGAEVNARDVDGKSALTFAVLLDRLPIVRILIERGADVNAKDRFGFTPLLQAAVKGKAPVIGFLLDHDADPKTVTPDGDNALMLSVSYNRIEAVRLFLGRSFDRDLRNRFGKSALSIAREKKLDTVAQLLSNHK